MELFACSGPGAGKAMAESVAIGYIHARVAAAMLLASLVVCAGAQRLWGVPAVLAGLLALHPAWTVSILRGDCGFMRREVS